jgi:hypothetical protein
MALISSETMPQFFKDFSDQAASFSSLSSLHLFLFLTKKVAKAASNIYVTA